jgi:hypothetical protein
MDGVSLQELEQVLLRPASRRSSLDDTLNQLRLSLLQQQQEQQLQQYDPQISSLFPSPIGSFLPSLLQPSAPDLNLPLRRSSDVSEAILKEAWLAQALAALGAAAPSSLYNNMSYLNPSFSNSLDLPSSLLALAPPLPQPPAASSNISQLSALSNLLGLNQAPRGDRLEQHYPNPSLRHDIPAEIRYENHPQMIDDSRHMGISLDRRLPLSGQRLYPGGDDMIMAPLPAPAPSSSEEAKTPSTPEKKKQRKL